MVGLANRQIDLTIVAMAATRRSLNYDGVDVFLPQVGKLQPGDILLTFNAVSEHQKGLKTSHSIRSITRGKFSHALICSAPPTFVEAIDTGVGTLSLALCFAHSLDHVRVLRYPVEAVARKAAALSQLEVGRDYSIARAVCTVMPEAVVRRIKDRGIFCSALVSEVFTAAGAREFQKTPSFRTTPATLEKMTGLIDITAQVFERGLAPRNIEMLSALDGDRVFSPASPQVEISNRYAKAVLDDAESLAHSYTHAELDPKASLNGMLQFIIDGFDAAARGEIPLPAIERIDDRLAELIGSGELIAVLREVQSRDEASLRRDLTESFQSIPDIDRTSLENYLVTSRSALDLRQRSVRAIEDKSSPSKAMNAYLPVDRLAIEHIARRIPVLEAILGRLPPKRAV